MAHIGLAMAFKAPELALTPEQATAMARASADVMQYYDTELPAKTMAWVNLAFCFGGVYFEKTATIVARKRMEAEHKNEVPQQGIFRMAA